MEDFNFFSCLYNVSPENLFRLSARKVWNMWLVNVPMFVFIRIECCKFWWTSFVLLIFNTPSILPLLICGTVLSYQMSSVLNFFFFDAEIPSFLWSLMELDFSLHSFQKLLLFSVYYLHIINRDIQNYRNKEKISELTNRGKMRFLSGNNN